MKKIGKKLSYFTKVLLVLSLIFTNLSSLSVVFAYEATGDFTVAVVDDNIEIKYLAEGLEDTDQVKIQISENYTYLDNTSETMTTISDTVSGLELTGLGVDITSTMLTNTFFDGIYEANVTLFNETDNVELGTVVYSENIEYNQGLAVNLYDEGNNLISANAKGEYNIPAGTSITIKSNILAGGLNPYDIYSYDEIEDVAKNLLDDEFVQVVDFNGKLFGKYDILVQVKMLDSDGQEVVFEKNISIMNDSYADNTSTLNTGISTLEEYNGLYTFSGEEKNGILYVLADEVNTRSLIDLYNIASLAVGGSSISFVISNSEYEDVVKAYEEATFLEEGVTLEDFLSGILLDDDTVLSFSNDILLEDGSVLSNLTISYDCQLVGDIDNDKILSQDDLLELIDQIVGVSEVDLEKSDVYTDNKLDMLDAMYLHQVLKNDSWGVEINKVQLQEALDARLDVMSDNIVSGDEFTIDYVLTLAEYAVSGIAGNVQYDKEMLELINVESSILIGNNNNGKFLYLSDNSMMGTQVEEDSTPEEDNAITDDSVVASEGNATEDNTIQPEDYVVLTMTFMAKKAGESTVSIDNPEYVNQNTYLELGDMEIATTVIVNESTDSSLASLKINDQVIELQDGVLDYEITVTNETTLAVIEALTNNVAASISSIVSPDELVEGKNTITIVVTAENGDERIYTITVIREEAPKEETVTYVNYQNNYNETPTDDSDDEIVSAPTNDDEEEDDDEVVTDKDGKLSRIIIIILILLVIAGLIYLIFKDEKEEDEETKKANKEINKLKKEDDFVKKTNDKPNNKSNNKPSNNSNSKKGNNSKNNKNKKKGR